MLFILFQGGSCYDAELLCKCPYKCVFEDFYSKMWYTILSAKAQICPMVTRPAGLARRTRWPIGVFSNQFWLHGMCSRGTSQKAYNLFTGRNVHVNIWGFTSLNPPSASTGHTNKHVGGTDEIILQRARVLSAHLFLWMHLWSSEGGNLCKCICIYYQCQEQTPNIVTLD